MTYSTIRRVLRIYRRNERTKLDEGDQPNWAETPHRGRVSIHPQPRRGKENEFETSGHSVVPFPCCRIAISRRCSPPTQSSSLSATTYNASTFCTVWSAWRTSPPWIRVVLAMEPTTSRSVLCFVFVLFSHAILRANALTIRSSSRQHSVTRGYSHIWLGTARQRAARAHREAVWRDHDGSAMAIGDGQSHTWRSDRVRAARRRCDPIDAAGSDPNRRLSLSMGHQRQVSRGAGSTGGMGLHVRRRNRVGEVQSESTPGEESRLLSSAFEGNVLGGEKSEDWRGLRRREIRRHWRTLGSNPMWFIRSDWGRVRSRLTSTRWLSVWCRTDTIWKCLEGETICGTIGWRLETSCNPSLAMCLLQTVRNMQRLHGIEVDAEALVVLVVIV